MTVYNEQEAYTDNLRIFQVVTEYFNNSSDVFYLLNKCYNREMF